MKLDNFCCIGAELQNKMTQSTKMAQIYFYRAFEDETLDEMLEPEFFNPVQDRIKVDDLVMLYDPDNSARLSWARVESNLGGIVTLEKVAIPAFNILIDDTDFQAITGQNLQDVLNSIDTELVGRVKLVSATTQIIDSDIAMALNRKILGTRTDDTPKILIWLANYPSGQQIEVGSESEPLMLNHLEVPGWSDKRIGVNYQAADGTQAATTILYASDAYTAVSDANKLVTFTELNAVSNGHFLGKAYWFGKTTTTFTPPAPNAITDLDPSVDLSRINYFDFPTLTVYEPTSDLTAWQVKEVVTVVDMETVLITKAFWDTAESGLPGTAQWSATTSSWAYMPQRFNDVDGVTLIRRSTDGALQIAPQGVGTAQLTNSNVTNAKLAPMGALTIKGNMNNLQGPAQDIPIQDLPISAGLPIGTRFWTDDQTLRTGEIYGHINTQILPAASIPAVINRFKEYQTDPTKGIPFIDLTTWQALRDNSDGQGVVEWAWDSSDSGQVITPFIPAGVSFNSAGGQAFSALMDSLQGHEHNINQGGTLTNNDTNLAQRAATFLGARNTVGIISDGINGPVRISTETRGKQHRLTPKIIVAPGYNAATDEEWAKFINSLNSKLDKGTPLSRDIFDPIEWKNENWVNILANQGTTTILNFTQDWTQFDYLVFQMGRSAAATSDTWLTQPMSVSMLKLYQQLGLTQLSLNGTNGLWYIINIAAATPLQMVNSSTGPNSFMNNVFGIKLKNKTAGDVGRLDFLGTFPTNATLMQVTPTALGQWAIVDADETQPNSPQTKYFSATDNTGTMIWRFGGIIDVSTLGLDYVIDSWSNGSSWYRRYKSGWVEQGGQVIFTTATVNVFLPVPYSTSNYTVVLGAGHNGSATTTVIVSSLAGAKTAAQFSIIGATSLLGPTYWNASGQGV